jgi:hypothetical protein
VDVSRAFFRIINFAYHYLQPLVSGATPAGELGQQIHGDVFDPQ